MTQQLQAIIDAAWEERANFSTQFVPTEVIDAI